MDNWPANRENRLMSIQDTIKQILISRGMSQKLADDVILYMKADPANISMQGRWQDDVKDYSEELLSILITCPQNNFGSIDEKSAKIWFRPLFVTTDAHVGS
jgi:hypothetical protein